MHFPPVASCFGSKSDASLATACRWNAAASFEATRIRTTSTGFYGRPATDIRKHAAAGRYNCAVRSRYAIFSHGQESGPWGTKITALATLAAAQGYRTHSVDYRGIEDPRVRIEKLLTDCRALEGDLVLCGSSMGGYVSVAAAAALRPRGLFLLAPALTLPNLPSLMGSTLQCPTVISHGLHDDVVPFERSVEFARMHGHTLHLLNSDHRLQDALPLISRLFEFFLVAL